MSQTAAKSREGIIKALTSQPLDLLIIGGGITGSGIARDAAMRGLKVGLVEQHDFAFGTSSRSSRLLHGGLRYLAQGRIGLVHEASVEKKIVNQIAPHLAAPLAFVFPTYSDNRDWKLWQLKIGVKIYDLLCGGRNLGTSSWLDKGEALRHVPGLAGTNLNGAVRYFDGLTNDARLVLDTLRSAENQGALLLNYCQFQDAKFVLGEWQCDLFDVAQASNLEVKAGYKAPVRLGAGSAANLQAGSPRYLVRTRAVVNATGPWADGLPHSAVKLRLTKGIHLVVERSRFPFPDAIVMTEGKRILFVIPWGDRTIIGTTDTDYDGSLDDVHANAEDIRYVLQITNQFFPKAKLTGQNVISTWAGLRPLIANSDGKPSDISRSHDIRSPEPFWWDVAGGKLTTYRLMAEQAVDQIVRKLGGNFSRCRTASEALLPPGEVAGVSGIVPPHFCKSAVEHFCLHEWVQHLDDIMIRRTSWHYYFRDADARALEAAEWMQEILGWDRSRKAVELLRYRGFSKWESTKPSSPSRVGEFAGKK
ncbi:MAG: glycerol-3-phosphate dehydrogenase/oxidase [Verrucomicrobiota bacterium]